VRLEPELANEPGKFGNIEVEFVPVAWGPRRYLIPAAKRREFCNAVMGGSEPRAHPQGRFLLRRGDETKPVSGRPQAAEGDLECLPDRPLQARIVSAGRRRDSIIRVVLDAGREEGVWEGMEFHPLPPEATYETARVTRVFERSSEAEFHPVAHDSFRPRPGWTLSTRRE
jgi:hypothetical protein